MPAAYHMVCCPWFPKEMTRPFRIKIEEAGNCFRIPRLYKTVPIRQEFLDDAESNFWNLHIKRNCARLRLVCPVRQLILRKRSRNDSFSDTRFRISFFASILTAMFFLYNMQRTLHSLIVSINNVQTIFPASKTGFTKLYAH